MTVQPTDQPDITKQRIVEIYYQESGDVCQTGLEVAYALGCHNDSYDTIHEVWEIFNDNGTFTPDMVDDGYSVQESFLPQVIDEWCDRLRDIGYTIPESSEQTDQLIDRN